MTHRELLADGLLLSLWTTVDDGLQNVHQLQELGTWEQLKKQVSELATDGCEGWTLQPATLQDVENSELSCFE